MKMPVPVLLLPDGDDEARLGDRGPQPEAHCNISIEEMGQVIVRRPCVGDRRNESQRLVGQDRQDPFDSGISPFEPIN
jgi:hypothetical protein